MSGQDTPLKDLVSLAASLKATRSRLEKRRLLAEFLREIPLEDVSPSVLLVTGRVLPESEQAALNVGWSTVSKALRSKGQATLVPRELTISQVYDLFRQIAVSSGKDSVKKRSRLLHALFSEATEEERDFLLRAISGEMRIGVNEGVLLEALADASGADIRLVQRANMFLGDLGKTALVAIRDGVVGLEAQDLKLFTPIKPMMAEMATDLEEALREQEEAVALEFKLDGARIQIHRKGGEVRIYSRRLTDVTESLPEVVTWAQGLGDGDLLVEGEVVAVDKEGRPLPFQDLMRRFRRVHGIPDLASQIPLELYLFDALVMEGRTLIDEPYESRWQALTQIAPLDLLVPRLLRPGPRDSDGFLRKALEAGHEGLMVKDLRSPYTPGKRGKKWLKVKQAETLDLAILAAEWGHGRRKGWLSNYHLGVRDASGGFQMIGKTFKGLTDEEFRWMTERLLRLKESETSYVVYVKPEVVVEVAFNEIQKSPHYDSGFALRFARISRIREDLSQEDVDTYERLKSLYGKQFERKGRYLEG